MALIHIYYKNIPFSSKQIVNVSSLVFFSFFSDFQFIINSSSSVKVDTFLLNRFVLRSIGSFVDQVRLQYAFYLGCEFFEKFAVLMQEEEPSHRFLTLSGATIYH